MGTKCPSAASPGDPLVSFPSLGKKLAAQGRVCEKKAPSLAAKFETLRAGAPSRGPGQLPLGLRAAALRRLASKCACGREFASAGQFTFSRPTTKTKLSRNCRRGRRLRRPAGGASPSPTFGLPLKGKVCGRAKAPLRKGAVAATRRRLGVPLQVRCRTRRTPGG